MHLCNGLRFTIYLLELITLKKKAYQWINCPFPPFLLFFPFHFFLFHHPSWEMFSQLWNYLIKRSSIPLFSFISTRIPWEILSTFFPYILYEATYMVVIRTKPLAEEYSRFESYAHSRLTPCPWVGGFISLWLSFLILKMVVIMFFLIGLS